MAKPLPMFAFAITLLCAVGAGAAPKPLKPVPTLTPASTESVQQHERVAKLLPSTTRLKGEAAGKSFASKTLETMTSAAVVAAARDTANTLVSGKNADIEALALLVLMEAAKAAREDLREIMASVKKINAEREVLEKAIAERVTKLGGGKKAPAPAYLKAFKSTKTPNLKLSYAIVPDGSATNCEIKDPEMCVDEFRQKLDSLSELSELQTAGIQLLMDRRAAALKAVSSVLKKVTDTSSQIIANMK